MSRENDLYDRASNIYGAMVRNPSFFMPGYRNDPIVNLAIYMWMFAYPKGTSIVRGSHIELDEFKKDVKVKAQKIWNNFHTKDDIINGDELDEVVERVCNYLPEWGPRGKEYLAAIYMID